MLPHRATRSALVLGSVCLAVTACGSTDAADPSTPSTGALSIGAVDLSDVCPSNVVIQTDWNPESEMGGLYGLLGPDATIDADAKVVRGPLFASGEWTGVDVEIRSGGPAIGFTGVPAQMYTDKDILLGWVNTDEAIASSAKMPTTAVMASFEKAPWMIMWDPETYPDVKTIADLGATGAKVRYFDGATWMDYLVGAGILDEAQIDGSYDGTPGNFVAAGGADGQQGFATVEPYVYENELDEWAKPVAYQLIADAGYPLYAVALSARTEDVTAEADCLKKLVPVVQQSTVDFFADPDDTNALITEAVEKFATGWVYPAGQAEHSTVKQLELGLVSNGDNATLGDFDEARVQKILDLAGPIVTANGTGPADGLTATDLFTNEFLDTTIGLPDSE
ncbi:ABC transporter substrate-binding protein [Cellulomonas sp. URHB0016]